MQKFLALSLLALTPALHAQTVLFRDDFESGLSNWTAETLWHLQPSTDPCSAPAVPFPSGTHALWFGNSQTCILAGPNGAWFDGFVEQVAPVFLPPGSDTIRLSLRSTSQAEDDGFWDRRTVWMLVDETGSWISLGNILSSTWQTPVFDLTRWAGHSVRLRLEFWTGDGWDNDGFGWFVDDVAIETSTNPGIVFCSGDGTGPRCPCNNVSGPGRGCPTSFDPQGALLAASGSASFSNDTLVLQASSVSQSAVTFFATTHSSVFGSTPTFGDGLRCADGTAIRARAFPKPAGMAQIPMSGDLPLGQRFNVTAIDPTRYIQALYRNAAPFCTSATFNLTNGLIVTWRP